MTNHPYIKIPANDQQYRKLIRVAIQVNDQAALSALKGRTDKPIHFVTNWFAYGLMVNDDDESDIVIIWSLQTRLDYAKFTKQQQGDREVANLENAIPVNTYDFLLKPINDAKRP